MKHARARGDGAGERHALLLAPGEDVRARPTRVNAARASLFASLQVSEGSPKATFC
ncbi:MAG TPA: hypothetical protein VGY14_05920 [Methyloceanibacter sp.]|nr:hypothetical protein [Methyloceanibacter sp.]